MRWVQFVKILKWTAIIGYTQKVLSIKSFLPLFSNQQHVYPSAVGQIRDIKNDHEPTQFRLRG